MENVWKPILKALAVVICVALLIWNAAQLKAIEKGTHEVTIEYGDYVADDAVGEYREAKILGIIPFAVEENQQKYGSAVIDTEVIAYYCIAILEDYSMGAVKLNAINGKLADYEKWVLETDNDFLNITQSEGFTIRGKTMMMPYFTTDYLGSIKNGNYDFSAMGEEGEDLNDSLDGITLLNATGHYPDVQTVIPDLPTLNGKENYVVAVLVISALAFAWDLLKIYAEKSAEKKAREMEKQTQQTAANGVYSGETK